jgi:hypothetical protein
VDPAAAVVTLCSHMYCRECITQWMEATANAKCPECREPVADDPLTPVGAVAAAIAKQVRKTPRRPSSRADSSLF